jgi:hypothetical protein
LNYKSKYYYPYILNYLNDKLILYNTQFFQKRKLFHSIHIISIKSNDTDLQFYENRMKLLAEEENLKICQKIHAFEENLKNIKNKQQLFLYQSEFTFLYNSIIFPEIINVIGLDVLIPTFYLILQKNPLFFTFSADSTTTIFYDENYKNIFETKILEFLGLILHLKKLQKEEQAERAQIPFENNITYLEYHYLTSSSSYKKSLLKPFNREDILYQEECETDYGDKRITKQDIKNRKDYIKKIIEKSNKELYEKVEDEIISGNFQEKQKKIVFCIPNDRTSIVNKLN